MVGDFAPKIVELTDGVLFGDIWERPQLSKRDRSLVTVSALIAMNRPGQLRSHLVRARDNGVTQEELFEAMTHLAFYAGSPSALTAIAVAKEVFEKEERAPISASACGSVAAFMSPSHNLMPPTPTNRKSCRALASEPHRVPPA